MNDIMSRMTTYNNSNNINKIYNSPLINSYSLNSSLINSSSLPNQKSNTPNSLNNIWVAVFFIIVILITLFTFYSIYSLSKTEKK